MLLTCPVTGNVYDLPARVVADLREIQVRHGNNEMVRLLGNYIPVARGNAGAEVQQRAQTFDDILENLAPRRTRKPAKDEFEPSPPLTFPIVPEVGSDGVKRLYKTRYVELEKMYTMLHETNNKNAAALAKMTDTAKDTQSQLLKSNIEVQRLKAMTVDTDKVDKLITKLCKEADIHLPNHPYGGLTLDQKLEAFFGAMFCHLRVEKVQDELAD